MTHKTCNQDCYLQLVKPHYCFFPWLARKNVIGGDGSPRRSTGTDDGMLLLLKSASLFVADFNGSKGKKRKKKRGMHTVRGACATAWCGQPLGGLCQAGLAGSALSSERPSQAPRCVGTAQLCHLACKQQTSGSSYAKMRRTVKRKTTGLSVWSILIDISGLFIFFFFFTYWLY